MGAETKWGVVIEMADRPVDRPVDRARSEATTVRVRGELTVLSCETLERAIRREVTLGAGRVILDASDVESVDSEVAEMLAALGNDVALEIRSPSALVRRSLEAAGFTELAPA